MHTAPASYPAYTGVSRFVPHAALAMGGVGAIIGGSASAARNLRKVREGELGKEEAIRDIVRDAAGSGLATGVATAAVGVIGGTGILSILGLLTIATGAKYIWDGAAKKPEK